MTPSNTTILLVEESRFFLTIEKQFLRNVPATILEAKNYEQAVALSRDTPPHLIYLALDLVGETGSDCCRKLKGDPQLKQIPVVMICDAGDERLIEDCRQAGCEAVITKPLDKQHFLEIGRSFLAGIRERRRPGLFKVQVQVSDAGKKFDAKGLDISSGGIFLETGEPLAVGTELQLSIHLCRPQESGPWVHCSGSVAWINTREAPLKPAHPFGYGIKFAELPVQSLGLLNGFLKSFDK